MKKKLRFYFLFILVPTHNNKIHTIYKKNHQWFCLDFQNLAEKPRCLIIEQKMFVIANIRRKKLTAELQKCVKVLIAKKLHNKNPRNAMREKTAIISL
jgi:hypothetical protein